MSSEKNVIIFQQSMDKRMLFFKQLMKSHLVLDYNFIIVSTASEAITALQKH